MKSAVIVFPGSNCDRDLAVALEQVTGRKPEMVWHKDAELPHGIDFIGVPGRRIAGRRRPWPGLLRLRRLHRGLAPPLGQIDSHSRNTASGRLSSQSTSARRGP